MADEVNAEFESYRRTLQTEEKKRLFDEKIKHLLELHGGGLRAWLCGRLKGQTRMRSRQ
jgi:hypothetical protein